MKDFVHLHLHTEFSLLDGSIRIGNLMDKVVQSGMHSVAITDHGVMYGVVDFYKEAKKKGIKPIIGCEVYTAPRTRFDKTYEHDSDPGHLVLLCKDEEGYANLVKIVSRSFTEGFYYKPRVDYELLSRYGKGLIALSACLSGDVPKALMANDYERALDTARVLSQIFGDNNFFLELQDNGIESQNLVNQGILKISRETGIPLVATNDVHYLNRKDAKAHDVLLCIQTGKTMEDDDRMRFPTDQFYLKSPEEMDSIFGKFPSSLSNTLEIAKRCQVDFTFGKLHLPSFDIKGRDHDEYLRERVAIGLKSRYGENPASVYIDRAQYEMKMIHEMGYIDYFLIVADFIDYARSQNIMVGPGRGSGAGSIVAYCLGITNVDPIRYGLLFERFLNPERVSMPDFDIDFCYERRQDVIDYVIEKYGQEKVCQIITFGTMAARGAIRDVGRALNFSYAETDVVAKMIPARVHVTIDEAMEMNRDLSNLYEGDDRIRELIDTARLLEGVARHASTHAAGVVIANKAVDEYVPIQLNEECVVTQYTMETLEELGLLKMDFLGLRTLTVLRDCVSFVRDGHGIEIDLDSMLYDDDSIFQMISTGNTGGIFQLESVGMTSFMKELKPENLEDIIAGISLYRPGPMDQIPRYMKNKKNRNRITYHHELLKPILEVTYGCMIYQEQVIQIVRDLGGYTMGHADVVRRAMSKKKTDVMNKEREAFIKGASVKGVPQGVADTIFDEMMDFASYAFNKSHAAAYAVIAYQTAFFKRYFPVEFMTATMNSFIGSSDRISVYIQQCKEMGIEVLRPDINSSGGRFSVEGKHIRYGLSAIKNVGAKVSLNLAAEREQGEKYSDFLDFCKRMANHEMNKKCVESLIKAGCFSSFPQNRRQLIASYEKIMDGIAADRKQNIAGQLSLFDLRSDAGIMIKAEYPALEEFPKHQLLAMEKEMLGLYFSGNPLDEYRDILMKKVNFHSHETKVSGSEPMEVPYTDGKKVICGGMVTGLSKKLTKSNNMMAFFQLEDLYGTMEVIVFPATYEKYADLVREDNKILVHGKLSMREEEDIKVICEEISPLDEVRVSQGSGKAVALYIDITGQDTDGVLLLLARHPGPCPVTLVKKDNGRKMAWTLPDKYRIQAGADVVEALKARLGEGNVHLKNI
ncbi:MAG: DNA polymerase III subunit alpha [Clostridia bacterium]